MTSSAKKQVHPKSYKLLSPEKSEVKMNEMQKSRPSLHNINPQKQQLTASKTIETKICKGVDGVDNFIGKTTTNPFKRFRSKNTRLVVHDVSKSYVKTTSYQYVAKTESQQREELHNRTMQTATTCSPSASVPLEQSINTFSEGNIKQTQLCIWKGRVFTLHLSKQNPKTNWKTRCWSTLKNSVHHNVKSFNGNFGKKAFPSNFL